MAETTKVELPKKYTAEEFGKEFQALCEKMGYQLVATPVWISRDDGTFSMKINWSIGELPKQTALDNT